MTPENQQKIDELYEFMQNLKADSRIPFDVAEAFKLRVGLDVPEGLTNAPVAAVSNPSGGATIDSQARAAIVSVIAALQTTGLMES